MMPPLCDYSQLPLDELTQLFIDFGVEKYLAPTIAGNYKHQFKDGPYSTDQVTNQINQLITDEVNAAVSALVNEGRCFLTVDAEGNDFHVGKNSI